MGGTALGGALLRGSDGCWYWADGTPEPRVTDLRMRDWFRFPTREENGSTLVEVPVKQAKADHQLRWILFERYEISQSMNFPSQKVTVRDGRSRSLFEDAPVVHDVYLVPQEDWDRVELEEVDARWDQAHQDDIIARAREVNARMATKPRRAS